MKSNKNPTKKGSDKIDDLLQDQINGDLDGSDHDITTKFTYDNKIPDMWRKPHIDKDEENLDLYICWKEFGIKPCRVGVYSEFNSDHLWDIINDNFNVEDKSINKISEIIPDGEGFIYNSKFLIRINENLYISFLEFDKMPSTDDTFCSNLTFYYNQLNFDVDDLNELLVIFQPAMMNNEIVDDMEKNIFSIHLNQNNQLELEHMNLELPDWDESNIDSIYNNKTLKKGRKLIKKVNKDNKGLHILCGDRGCGKTSFLKLIISKLKKKVIYIPLTMVEHTFNNIDFLNFINLNKDSVIVLDDSENYFNRIHQKSNIYVSNVIQMLDSLNSVDSHIILSMNIKPEFIDDNLIECNNFISLIEFDKISDKKASKISKKMGFNKKYLSSTSLSDVMNDRVNDNKKYL